MSARRTVMAVLAAGVVVLGVSACAKKSDEKPAEQTTTSTTASSGPATTKAVTGTTIAGAKADPNGQWAVSATATTSYGPSPETGWSAKQATGAPDVTPDTCGDIGEAWASAQRNTVDTLTLTYAKAVVPTGINVWETFNPGAIVKVTVSDGGAQSKVVYESTPKKVTECPRVLKIPVTGVSFAVNTVAITVDQTQEQDWAEIDAVELVGTAARSGPTG